MKELKNSSSLREIKNLDSVSGGKSVNKFLNKSLAAAVAVLSLGGSLTVPSDAVPLKRLPSNRVKHVKKIDPKDYNFTWKDWSNIGLTSLGAGLFIYVLKKCFSNGISENDHANFKRSNFESCTDDKEKPFSGIQNPDFRCYINAYVQLLHEIPEVKQFVYNNKSKHAVFDKLNKVFSKMDKFQPITRNDEDYSEFCRLVGHVSYKQRSYDNIAESLNRIFLDQKISPTFSQLLNSDSILLISNEICGSVEERIQDKDNFALITIERGTWDSAGATKIDRSVNIPEFVKNKNGKKLKLMGIVFHHSGEVSRGHYTTIKRDKNNKWWHCDDDNVMLQSASSDYLNTAEYAKKNAVLLYYRAEN